MSINRKKPLSILLVIFVFVLAFTNGFTVSAIEDSITYRFVIKSQKVCALRGTVSFPSKALSVTHISFFDDSATYSQSKGKVNFAFTSSEDEYDFSVQNTVVEIKFDVLNSYNKSDIKTELKEIYNTDLVASSSGGNVAFSFFNVVDGKTTSSGYNDLDVQTNSYEYGETPTENLRFSGASLTLYDNIAINYKVPMSVIDCGYYAPYVLFNFNGQEIKVNKYTIDGNSYVFSFRKIAPNQMNDTVQATLYADYKGQECSSKTREYSVKTYCDNMLSKYSSDSYAKFRTLLVDLLNYGEKSQVYTNYKTDNLVNASLTETQRAWGTNETPSYSTVQNTKFKEIQNPAVKWRGAGLSLSDSVTMRFKIDADDITGLKAEVKSNSGEVWNIPYTSFEETNGGYYIYFGSYSAGEMSEPVYVTIKNGNTAVSHTIRYSIESYAYAQQSTNDTNLKQLLEAMMKYGNSAYLYNQ